MSHHLYSKGHLLNLRGLSLESVDIYCNWVPSAGTEVITLGMQETRNTWSSTSVSFINNLYDKINNLVWRWDYILSYNWGDYLKLSVIGTKGRWPLNLWGSVLEFNTLHSMRCMAVFISSSFSSINDMCKYMSFYVFVLFDFWLKNCHNTIHIMVT